MAGFWCFFRVADCRLLVFHMVERGGGKIRNQGESLKAVVENGHERGEREVEEREVRETETDIDREKENTSSKRPSRQEKP